MPWNIPANQQPIHGSECKKAALTLSDHLAATPCARAPLCSDARSRRFTEAPLHLIIFSATRRKVSGRNGKRTHPYASSNPNKPGRRVHFIFESNIQSQEAYPLTVFAGNRHETVSIRAAAPCQPNGESARSLQTQK
jgi:hypothetical protein